MATANQPKPLETQPKPECKMKLPKPGCNIYNRIHVKNYRDVLMCGAGVIVGKGRNARAHMHCTIGISVATPDTPNKIDAAKLAKELGVDMVKAELEHLMWRVVRKDETRPRRSRERGTHYLPFVRWYTTWYTTSSSSTVSQ